MSMSDIICVSHPKRLQIANWLGLGHSKKSLGKVLDWHSDELDVPTFATCTASFEDTQFFSNISIDFHKDYPKSFPSKLRFEASLDGRVWEPLIYEAEIHLSSGQKSRWSFSLTSARYVRLVFLIDKKNQSGKYFSAFGEIQFLILGATQIETSSELDRLWVKENVIDRRPEYGWSTAPRLRQEKEYIQMDLGSINQLCEVRILSKADVDTFFPVSFQFLYSEDDITWHLIFEENGFLADIGCWYRWRFLPINSRYIRLVVTEGARTNEGKYISQIVEIELYATAELYDRSISTSHSSPPASTLRSGVVRLALDGENQEGVALQANDCRIAPATSSSQGIVELAFDGEEKENAVVQASDKRLKPASEDLPGIVRLARDSEKRSGFVVQSSDSRLELATEEQAGLVELAADGESRAGIAVQGNDKRLHYATEKKTGIVALAADGEEEPNKVVQGNDHRLRNAHVESAGIVRLARHGEITPEVAIQSDDSRVQPATTERKGIVELATDREQQEGKVVQGNDSRLKDATEEASGLVKLGPMGTAMEGCVVQSNDPRLKDSRSPLAHSHDYAPTKHDFNSHEGTINIETNQGKKCKGATAPSSDHAPIIGNNKGEGSGIVGCGEIEGVVGVGGNSGVSAFGVKDGCGLLGVSHHNTAGMFLSRNFYSIIAGGELQERDIKASRLALLSKGISNFEDSIYSSVDPGCIASYFSVGDKEHIKPGDLVAINEKGKEVYRPTDYGDLHVLGVAVSQAAIVLNPPGELLPKSNDTDRTPFTLLPVPGKVLIAVGGIVEVQVNADIRPIHAGNLLVSSMEAGTAEVLDPQNYRPGMVFARSLGFLEKGKGKVKAILSIV